MASILECRVESLPEKESDDLARWLSRPELATLTRIVESKVREHLSKAMEDAVKGNDFPLKIDGANAELVKVHRYNTFLAVLEEIRAAPRHTVNKWNNP